MIVPPKEGSVTRTEFNAMRHELAGVKEDAAETKALALQTHGLVLAIHAGLMQPQPGQDKSLLYQFALMLDEWKRHKWAFQTVIWLAGAVVTLSAAFVALRIGFWDGQK